MKYFVLILTAIVLFSCSSKHAVKTIVGNNSSLKDTILPLKMFYGDTLKYLTEQFENRKEKYIGKELAKLLIDLELPIKQYMYGSNVKKTSISEELTLVFYDRWEMEAKKIPGINPRFIIITWKEPLKMEDVLAKSREGKGKWTKEVMNYYSQQIIGDIKISPNF